ncbi:MAG: hypothetical protein ACE366_00385 [Bradymonadia bacterium]
MHRLIRGALWATFSVGVAALTTGCGPCQEIAAHRDAFMNRQPVAQQTAPHLSIAIPQKMLDDAISAGIDRITPKSIPIPGMGRLADYVKDFKVAPKRMVITQTQKGQYKMGLDLDVGYGSRSLFTMSMATETKPVADAKKGTLELAFRADDLKSVTPSVSANAGSKLVSALMSNVPSLVRNLVPERQVRQLADGAIKYLTDNAFRLLQSQVLKPIGELARVRFTLPDLPIAELSLSSANGVFQVNARTTLPVSTGLNPMTASMARSLPSDRVHVRIAPATAVELANWAIAGGKLPSTYDMSGKASPSGTFTPAVEWAGGAKPLKVNVWSAQGACIRARIAADPSVALSKGALDLGVNGVEIEEIIGPPLITDGTAWAKQLWGDSMGKTKASFSTAALGMGKGGDKGLNLSTVALNKDALSFSFKIGKSAPKKARSAPKAWVPVNRSMPLACR